MSFNVGNGLFTTHISLQRLHDIKGNSASPEATLWEKIKDFFFSTRQQEALECIHKLYHSADAQGEDHEIRDTFIKLRELAAPGCRNKFTIDSNSMNYIYKIDGQTILSHPKNSAVLISNNNEVRRDDHDDEIWYDCHDDETWHDCQDDDDSGDDYNIRLNNPDTFIAPQQGPDNKPPEAVRDLTHIAAADNITISAEKNVLLENQRYIQSVNTLMHAFNESVMETGIGNFSAKLGLRKSLTALSISRRILKKLSGPIKSTGPIKKDIESLLKIPGLVDLIPLNIVKTAEFASIIQGLHH